MEADLDDGPALQDVLQVHCYGCGALNARGLQIKSRWLGDELVCRWQPGPQHIGYPGYVFGGTIASVVDCHAVWAALARYCRDNGHDLAAGPPTQTFVTASLSVSFLKPARSSQALELRASVREASGRKYAVVCTVESAGQVCAQAEVLVVAVATERLQAA